MAERSKALRSARSPVLWAWVQIPLLTKFIFCNYDNYCLKHHAGPTHLSRILKLLKFGSRAETWRRIWVGPKNFFRGPISGKIFILRVKISNEVFLVIDLVLRIFPFFSHIFRMFTMLNVVYDHFLTRKPPLFTLFILSLTSDNTTSQNIGGTNARAVPPPQTFGRTIPPVLP